MPFFSVVIPLYNKQFDIKKTLQSVYSQNFTDFEVILVNDGSTDGSEASALAITDPRLKYYKTVNQGISEARNFGIDKATANMVAFLDADDLWYPNHLEVLYKLHRSFPEAGVVGTNYEFLYPDNVVKKTRFDNVNPDFFGLVPNIFEISLKDRALWTSAVAVKKDVFAVAGNFDTNITLGAGEDTDMWIRIALKYPVAYIAEVTASYNLNAGNRVSHSQTLKRKFSRLDKFKEQEKTNKPLQKFLDVYRASYAMKHKLAGDSATFTFYRNAIHKDNLPLKTKILLGMPCFMLRALYAVTQRLKKQSVRIDIYN
ncbi:glycosyltransferase family 2 protein [Flavobacterium subsaxonicum]|uniref:glycosyltransferase family 2 protein n=1 Tax=Flavobacterium subsaxonicum TaxID=426226 RepID=UPI00041DA754|nr:glycosyltransferase family A protein [Flavobacterium subsaxonicum]